jgi:hypothetical protein
MIVAESHGGRLALAGLFAATTLLLVQSARAPGAAAPQLTPVVASVITAPQPVLAADGRRHLAYELRLLNLSSSEATVERVDAIASGRVVASLSGARLAALMLRPEEHRRVNTLPAGHVAVLLMDASFDRRSRVPERLVHRITISLRPENPFAATTYTAAPVRVAHRGAVVVDPPLRGDRWVVGNGCCDSAGAHRSALLPVNGALRVPERFAIDFAQINSADRAVSGPIDENSSFAFYGDPVLSATAGTVVSAVDNLPDLKPGALPPPGPIQDVTGNYVVVAIGHGRWAFYGHLQPASIVVRAGQRVNAGQTLGRLGNSGNSDAPHLHFEIMDGPTLQASSGLPFRFRRFTGEGRIANFLPFLLEGHRAAIKPQLRGPHRNELPLNDEVIGFR